MTIETELKLRITQGQLARLKRHALLKAHQVTRPVTRRLYNIYYDTPTLELQKSGMALRLRRSGRQWLQTLKGGGSVKAGMHQRNEWEVPVKGMALDFSRLAESGGPQAADWEEHLPKALRNELQPVFVTDFSRSSRMVQWQDALIELSMDQGSISTEQGSIPVCELELELKCGQPRQLFELALAILESVPFELELVSKAEQGYRLLTGYSAKSVKSTVPDVSFDDTLPDVLQAAIWSCLHHFQGNVRGAMDGDDAEYLHQMRVALRRLRVVLRMAEKNRADEQLAALSKEVAALSVTCGRAREWDAFIAQTVQPVCARMPGNAGLQALLAGSRHKRDACYAELRSPVQVHEVQRLILRLAIWMNGAYWQQWQTAPPARDFAARRLQKLARRFSQSARHPDFLEAERLHALRILAKKLRYTAEFFAGLYTKTKAKSFIAAMSEVQDVLGQISDSAASHRLLDKLAASRDLSAHQDAVALAREWVAHDLPRQFTELRKALQRFQRKKPFWEN